MPDRVMFVQLKTGHGTDKGPCWISVVSFNRTWQTARWHGLTLHRLRRGWDANVVDAETGDEYWLSGPHRDQQDTRYSGIRPTVDDDAREAYEAFHAARARPRLRTRRRGSAGRDLADQR